MTVLNRFLATFDLWGSSIVISLDGDSAYALQGGRVEFEAAAGTSLFNWIGNSNWLYRDYHGKSGANHVSSNNQTYATFMKANHPVKFAFYDDRVVLRMSRELYETFSAHRNSWETDFKSFVTTFLSTH